MIDEVKNLSESRKIAGFDLKNFDQMVQKGITALANVTAVDKEGWSRGHIGASIIAAAYLLRDKHVIGEASLSLVERIDLIVSENTDLFQALQGKPGDIKLILDAIEIYNDPLILDQGHN